MTRDELELLIWADEYVPRRRDPGVYSNWLCPACGGEGTGIRTGPMKHEPGCKLIRWQDMLEEHKNAMNERHAT